MAETTTVNSSKATEYEKRILFLIRNLKEFEKLEIAVVGNELQIVYRSTTKEVFPLASVVELP